MSQKRQQQEDPKPPSDKDHSSEDKRRKVPSLRSVVAEVITLRRMQNFMEPVLEPLIRKIVKEEVDSALGKYLMSMRWTCGKDSYSSESRSLRLKFSNSLSLPVFTGTRIEAEDCSSLQVTLIDALTRQVVSTGSHCCAKVEIVVLEGDFDSDEGDNWTSHEFKNNIVKEREGKKPLLNGDTFLTLKDGASLVSDISFTDNSSWTRSRKFRLGARVVDNSGRIQIREAKTEPFIVRDHRGELYKKHHPPSLNDEVWRLEKIGKEGAFHRRLSKDRVFSVQDFLTLYFLDRSRLRNTLGPGMSAKMWEATVEHARTCVLDKKLYVYYSPGSQQQQGVVFTIVGQLIGVFRDSQYISSQKLSELEKGEARCVVITAFKNWHEVVIFDDEASVMDLSPGLSGADESSNTPMLSHSDSSKALASYKNENYPEPSTSSPDIFPSMYSLNAMAGLDEFDLQRLYSMDIPGQVGGNNLICDTESMTQAFREDEHMHFFDSHYALHHNSTPRPPNDLQSAVNDFIGRPSSLVKAQRRWKIIFSILRWFSIRKIVARRYGAMKAVC